MFHVKQSFDQVMESLYPGRVPERLHGDGESSSEGPEPSTPPCTRSEPFPAIFHSETHSTRLLSWHFIRRVLRAISTGRTNWQFRRCLKRPQIKTPLTAYRANAKWLHSTGLPSASAIKTVGSIASGSPETSGFGPSISGSWIL